MRIIWDDFVLKFFWMLWKAHCQEYFSSFLHIFVWFSCYSSFFSSLFWHWCWLVTQGEIIWGSHMNEYSWKLCCKFYYWTKKHEFELCEVKFGSYMWKCSSSCCVFSFRQCVWHFIIERIKKWTLLDLFGEAQGWEEDLGLIHGI